MGEVKKLDFDADSTPILGEEDEATPAAIDHGIKAADEGRLVPLQEVRRRMEQWATKSSSLKSSLVDLENQFSKMSGAPEANLDKRSGDQEPERLPSSVFRIGDPGSPGYRVSSTAASQTSAQSVGAILVCYFCNNNLGIPPQTDGPVFIIQNTSSLPITGAQLTINPPGGVSDSFQVGTLAAGSTFLLTPGVSNDGGTGHTFFKVTGVALDTSDSGPNSDSTQFRFTGTQNSKPVDSGIFTPQATRGLSNDGAESVNFLGNEDADCFDCFGPKLVATLSVGANIPCTYTLAASSASVGATASTGSVQVIAPAGCPYAASALSGSFASITNGASGSGNGTLNYSVQANSGTTARSTTLTIAGLPFTINQLNGCLFGLTPSNAFFTSVAGTGNIAVGASSSTCPFTATSNSTWLTLNSSSGTGSSTIGYSVQANSLAAGRTGSLTVAGQTFTVVQAGSACSFALSQASQSFTAAGGTGSASVQAPAGCAWTAQSNSPFVTVTAGASGAGNGTASYAVQSNAATTQRTGSLTIAGLTDAVVQAGAAPLNCTASVPATPQAAIEGRTEILGDLILTCTGLTSALTADISLTLNTNVTNAITAGATDASLLVNGANSLPGATSGYNTVDWPAVSLMPASGGTATVRITNVRADASLSGAAANLQSTPITGVVSVNAVVTVPVINASQILAYAAPTLVFQKQPSTLQGTTTTIPLQYQDASLAAFHAAAGTTPATRLRLVVSGVPAGVQVLAPVFPNEGTARAQLFSADVNGFGGSAVAGSAGSIQQLPVVGGVATATWVVLSADPANFETDTFPLMLQNPGGVSLGSIQISASLGPVSTVSVASAAAPVPRFRDFSVPLPLVNLRATTAAAVQGNSSSSVLFNHAKTVSRLSGAVVQPNATFTGQVTNDNQDTSATNVIVRPKVDGGTITNCSSTAGNCTVSGDGATIDVSTLAPMQTASFTVTAMGNPCTADVCELGFEVHSESDQPNADLSASSASSVLLINGSPAGTAANLTASGGTPQSAAAGTAFASPLQVTVMDSGGNPVSGVSVTFSSPSSGASAALLPGTAVTNASGVASVSATANSTAGSYTVTAAAGALSVSFSLTNTSSGPPSSGDLAQGKVATQSSTLPGTPAAGAAVDGNTDGAFSDGSVTATNLDSNAWWQVDLGASATVNSVVIWNRTDCCGSRLNDYWVFVSNTPFLSSDTPATLQNRAGTFASHQTAAPNPSTTIAVGGAQGQYVRVQLTGPNYLSLAEVQVIGAGGGSTVNLAMGQPATQSSALPGTPPAGAAVDGNTDGLFFDGSVTATNLDNNAWWQVDLGASASVSSVVVWNRTDCCGSRLNDYWVFVSNTPFLNSDTPATLQNRAGTFSSHQTTAPNPSTSIPVGTQGRYVRVQLSNPNYLSLAEVQVLGSGSAAPASTNLAQGKSAAQSSTLPGTPAASVAVDGNTDGSFGDDSVTATNLDSNPWWQVDLGSSASVSSVVVWNRTDCCGSRLNDYWVFVSNTPFLNSDTPATLQNRAGTFSSHQTTAPNPSTSVTVGTQGRYVRVQLSSPNYLSLAEVQVFGSGPAGPAATNLAIGQPATQSSVLPGTPPAGAAVDGNTDGLFFDGSVTATNPDNNAWWQVDLGSPASVNSVVVWNRTDCCGSRLNDYWVFVSNTPFLSSDTPATLQNRAGTFSSHQTSAPNPSSSIAVGAPGRYVRVQLTGANYLSLAEVQVFGTAGADSNLAVGKAASQSSTLPGAPPAAVAVDGNTDGVFFDGSVTATNLDANPWWQVDLGATATVSSVTVFNRTDCCGSRLGDYWVFVSNTPFLAFDTPTTLQGRAGTFSSHQIAAPSPSSTIAVGAQGRYVRVQLTSAGYLSLAEVQVFGH